MILCILPFFIMTNCTETAPAHTPGPWTVEPDDNAFGVYRVHPACEELTRMFNNDDGEDDACPAFGIDRANARLIAAAPDLLAALRHAYQRLNDIPHDYHATDFRLLRDALRRAGGRAA